LATSNKLRGGSQTKRASANHGDGKIFEQGLGNFLSFQDYRNSQTKKLCDRLSFHDGAAGFGTALIYKKSDEAVHSGIVGATDKRRHLTFLGDEPRQNQSMQVMGERRGSYFKLLLQSADWQALITRPDEYAIDLKPCRIAKRFELFCGFFEFHGISFYSPVQWVSINISTIVEII
jgi:hypothetical protein